MQNHIENSNVAAKTHQTATAASFRTDEPVYRIKSTESIEDLFLLGDDDHENGDWTDALLA